MARTSLCCYLLATQTHIDQQPPRRCSSSSPTFSLHSGFNLICPIAPHRPLAARCCLLIPRIPLGGVQVGNICNFWVCRLVKLLLSLPITFSYCKPMTGSMKKIAVNRINFEAIAIKLPRCQNNQWTAVLVFEWPKLRLWQCRNNRPKATVHGEKIVFQQKLWSINSTVFLQRKSLTWLFYQSAIIY